jgi:threonine aldolase
MEEQVEQIDIRSDTVTRPTEAMRKAMAVAEVGDDVYGDDPTVRKLEALGAQMLGKEAALFVPSGTFGNQLALFTWCERGSEVILGEESHIIQHEAAAASIIAGVQTRPIPAPDGALSAEALRLRLRRRELHEPATSLICLENAHSSGRVVPLAMMDEARSLANEWGIPVHLDGARIFNAALALESNTPESNTPEIKAEEIARRADSVMFCLSKGLCAPVGSLLAGKRDFVAEARMRRKIMGGGLRQAGVLAAAGLLALKEQVACLAQDHGRAKQLAKGLAAIPGLVIRPEDTEINMVFFSFPPARKPEKAAGIVEAFARRGIRINEPRLGEFRFVTHYWVGDREIDAVLEASREVFRV